jgi:hypothetical protein
MCDPPDIVCNRSTMQCVVGCILDPDLCYGGWICAYSTGHCCDPHDPGCLPPADGGAGCSADTDCAGSPGTVCEVGACVPGCAQAGCAMPMVCLPSGHCGPPGNACARDADCDAGSICVGGTCSVAPNGGATTCAGGTVVRTTCNQLSSVSQWRFCVGAAGPAACPYCVDGSCYRPGICSLDTECHTGTRCTNGLCSPASPACPSTVAAADIQAGGFASGHELCVHEIVESGVTDYNGDTVLKLGPTGLYGIVSPLYQSTLAPVTVGQPATLHGTVRWNAWRTRWELHPIDWIGP